LSVVRWSLFVGRCQTLSSRSLLAAPRSPSRAMRLSHGCHRLILLDAWPGDPDTRLVLHAFPEPMRDACGVALLADLRGESRPDILPATLAALRRLAHRGAVDADARTGDGAGVLTSIPFSLFARWHRRRRSARACAT